MSSNTLIAISVSIFVAVMAMALFVLLVATSVSARQKEYREWRQFNAPKIADCMKEHRLAYSDCAWVSYQEEKARHD